MRNTADTRSQILLTLYVSVALASGACKKNSDQPVSQAGYPTQAPNAAPVRQAPGYGDGTAQSPAVLAASPAPGAATTPGAAALSQPSPLALPCATDVQCLTHRCNVAAGKCAWPCQSDNDCVPGNACIAPTCLPKLQ